MKKKKKTNKQTNKQACCPTAHKNKVSKLAILNKIL